MSTDTTSELPNTPPGTALEATPDADADPDHSRRPEPRPTAGPCPCPGDLVVEVSDTQTHLAIEAEVLVEVVRRASGALGIERGEISVAVVDDAAIRVVNRRHLGHDWPTDVISFALSGPDDDTGLTGELVVSAEMAVTTAREAGVPPWDELVLYVVHGLLHLCGHDDSTPAARRLMRQREDEILTALGLTNTFPAVGLAGDENADEAREAAPCTV
jgi:probable rRNA maturation factor